MPAAKRSTSDRDKAAWEKNAEAAGKHAAKLLEKHERLSQKQVVDLPAKMEELQARHDKQLGKVRAEMEALDDQLKSLGQEIDALAAYAKKREGASRKVFKQGKLKEHKRRERSRPPSRSPSKSRAKSPSRSRARSP